MLPGIPHRFEVNGIVVWSNPGSSRSSLPSGMGIKLVDLDPRSKQLLAEFIKAKSRAPVPGKRDEGSDRHAESDGEAR
jgi:Tfp pilus assembly protein PilZ